MDMRLFLKLFVAIAIFVSAGINCSFLMAQDVESLPDDPRVKRGSLANGLSYVIIKNGAEKGYAHFGIAQRVGTTLEEDGQKGMFRMLEALTVKGTRNFTDSTITTYLKSIGVRPQDISFETGEDDVTYLIKNVPVSNANTVDSSLLILYNWLNSINIDEEDIKEEAPFVKNAMVHEWDAAKRLDDKLLLELYPNSRYAMDLRPEDITRIDEFTSKELRNFYYKWFRSDFQSVVIVGDVDPSLMETKVKSIFSTIPKPLDKQERCYYTPEPFDGVKVFILKDKEYNKTRISIDILKEPLLKKYRNTSVPFIQDYMDTAISKLLFARLRDGIISNGLPISGLEIVKGTFMNIHNQDAFSITFETLPNMIYSAIAFVNAEIGKMAKYGFNGQEFSRSKEIYFRELEKMYDNRMKEGNDFYLKRALDHIYKAGSLASVELKFEIMKEILFSLSLNQLNQYANAMLGVSDNIVISCRMPEYEGMDSVTPERVLAAYRDAGLSTPSRQPAAPIVKWPEFVRGSMGTSRVVSEVADPVTGAIVIMLSNGATVVLKRNMSDTISFRAVSKGGYSLMTDSNYSSQEYLNDILNLGGLGNISQPNLERLYSYHNFKIEASIRQNIEKLEGYAYKTEVEKLFHAILMSMTARRADEPTFELYRQAKIFETSYRSLAPSAAFKDSILNYNFSNRNYMRKIDNEDISNWNYSTMLEKMRERFSNAADFVFVFVGNIDLEEYKSLAVDYIGAIPGNSMQKEDWLVVPNYLTKGKVEKRFLYRMMNPRSFTNITRSCGMEYNLSNNVMSELVGVYLNNMLEQRANKKYIMQYDMKCSLKNYPEQIFVVQANFETDSINAQVVRDIVDAALQKAAAGDITEDQMASLKRVLKERFLENNITNEFWLDVFEHRYMTGKDFFNNYMKSLDQISIDSFKGFVSRLLNEGNEVSVIMDGTTRDVNTQNLFKEDLFIKEYFNVN